MCHPASSPEHAITVEDLMNFFLDAHPQSEIHKAEKVGDLKAPQQHSCRVTLEDDKLCPLESVAF